MRPISITLPTTILSKKDCDNILLLKRFIDLNATPEEVCAVLDLTNTGTLRTRGVFGSNVFYSHVAEAYAYITKTIEHLDCKEISVHTASPFLQQHGVPDIFVGSWEKNELLGSYFKMQQMLEVKLTSAKDLSNIERSLTHQYYLRLKHHINIIEQHSPLFATEKGKLVTECVIFKKRSFT